MSIADSTIADVADAIDHAQRGSWHRSAGIPSRAQSLDRQRRMVNQLGDRLDDTLQSLAAEHRIRARRRRTAVDGVVVALSTFALITGAGWLAMLGPMLIAAWHTGGRSRAYQHGLHRSDADAPRHSGGRFPRLQHR